MDDDVKETGEEVAVCPHCMAENEEGVHLCVGCGRPMSSHASIDPVMSIAARADTFGKAANSPQKLAVVVGMWLILGPTFVISAFWVMGWVSAFFRGDSELIATVFGSLVMGVFTFISGALLWKVTANYVRRPREAEEEKREEEMREDESWEEKRGDGEERRGADED